MKKIPELMFQPDQPITKCCEDKLERKSFAESLANAILSYKSKECIVIGLFGSWGTGKTSLINMCLECINKTVNSYPENEKPIIIEFNPWNYSGQQQLILQFFNHLSLSLSKHQSKEIKEIGKKIISYVKAILPIEMSSIKLGPFSLKLKKLKQESLEDQKDYLCQLLKNQSHKIIVVIDDIDRLNNYEIRQIFQLIKVLGNLPNIIYLVAFDKDIVIKALEKEQGGSGLEYLEKIVQVPFEIPPVPKEKIYDELLFSQLDESINELINELIKNIPKEEKKVIYYQHNISNGIKVFFNTIRDVTRYLNIFRSKFPMVKEEVNPIDFIAITSFQVFLPKLYYAIRNNKDLFTEEIRQERIEQERKQCNEILNLVPENIRENIKELLTYLFPKLGSIWGNKKYRSDRQWSRICNPNLFDIYFRLVIPEGEFSQKEIKAILSLGNDPDSFTEELLKLNRDGKIIKFLKKLKNSTHYIPEKNIEPIISVLMDIGDLFPFPEHDTFETLGIILEICRQLTQRLDSHDKRFKVFKNAIEKATRSLVTIVYIVDNYPIYIERIVNAEQLKALESTLNKIETWANDGRLKKLKVLAPILSRWRKWGGGDKVNRFVEDMIESDEGLIDFITAFLIKSTTTEDVFHWEINIKSIESIKKYIEIEKIEPRIRRIINSEGYTNLNEKQKIALRTFIDTIDGKNNEW